MLLSEVTTVKTMTVATTEATATISKDTLCNNQVFYCTVKSAAFISSSFSSSSEMKNALFYQKRIEKLQQKRRTTEGEGRHQY